jgi:hypothetical protein
METHRSPADLARASTTVLAYYGAMQSRCGIKSPVSYGWEIPPGGWATNPSEVVLVTKVKTLVHRERFRRDDIEAFARDPRAITPVKTRLYNLAVSVAEVS